MITVARSLGIRFTLAVQALEQLKNKYPRAHETIRGNTGSWVFLKTQDDATAQTISGMIGEYTLAKASTTMPKLSFFNSSVPGSATESNQLAARALATKDEILRWPKGQSLVLQAGYAPARLLLPDLSQWSAVFPALQSRHDATLAPAGSPAIPALWPLAAWLNDPDRDQAKTPQRVSGGGIDGVFRG